MSIIEIKIPQMGEGVIEATIIKWHVKQNEIVNTDDVLCDIATDKVDSEITAPKAGIIQEILYPEGSIVAVGKTIAKIKTNDLSEEILTTASENPTFKKFATIQPDTILPDTEEKNTSNTFLSPLVKQIIKENNISAEEIAQIKGTGLNGRITKDDILEYLKNRNQQVEIQTEKTKTTLDLTQENSVNQDFTIIEMNRIRKIIANHMIQSIQTSAHVTSFVEADVTKIVKWREKYKDIYQSKYGFKLTYLPVFVHELTKALIKYPMLNASVEGDKIILRKNINIGIATALPDYNLIVPVIKNADQLNIIGIAKNIDELAKRAKENKLQPHEITGGTFSVTNLGTFKTLAGTPIINQPQVAILGIGEIRKVPAVIETPEGDYIGIRHKVILSLSFDHRIIDGMLAGLFLQYYVKLLENIDLD